MPTVLRSGPYRLYFYSADRLEPAHIHVRRERRRTKVWLSPVEVSWNRGVASRELGDSVKLVEENRQVLPGSWNEHFTD